MNTHLLERTLMLSPEHIHQRVGGLGVHVADLAPRLSDHIPVDLIVPRYNDLGMPLESMGKYGHIHRVDAQPPALGPQFDIDVWRMNDQLNTYITDAIHDGYQFALLHAHDWMVGFAANDLHRRYHIPLIVTIHATEKGRRNGNCNDPLSDRIHCAEWHLAHEADRIIACSQFMMNEIVQTLEVSPAKIIVVPNGVEFDRFSNLRQQRSDLTAFRRQWAAPDETLIFSIGRLVWEKGADVLAAALADVVKTSPRVRAVIAGTGPQSDALARQVHSLGLEQHIHLPGFIDDDTRDALYAVADVAVFPSRYEPFGIVALEAMAAGVPVIVSGVGGLGEVVQHGHTGLCVQPDHADALAQALVETLSYPDAAAARALRAQTVVQTAYNWERLAELTLDVYESVLH